jgi:hypothetical protein
VKKNPIIMIGTKCPVTARLRKAPKPLHSTPEWEVKTYATPSTAGRIEGYVPGTSDADWQNNIAQRKYLKGRFIRLERDVRVTKEAQLMVNQYTTSKDPLADNTTDKMVELHRDIETTLLKDQEAVAPVASTTASLTRSIPRWLSLDDTRFTDTDTTPDSTRRTPTGSILVSKAAASDVTEPNVRAVLQSVATAREEDSTAFLGVCSPAMRTQFTSFSLTDKLGSSDTNFPLRRWNQKEHEVTAKVTRYNSDFGPIDLITSFRMDSSVHFLFLDMDMLEIQYAQAPMITPLPADGAGEKRQIDAILVCAVLNPQAHGKATSEATA